jgi:hypothetical protein
LRTALASALLGLALLSCCPAVEAETAGHRGGASVAPAPARSHARSRAPGGPPLLEGEHGGAAADEEGAPGSEPAELDPLVSNGLTSPLCRGTLDEGEMAAAARRHCETSGFVAAPAPTGDYGIDVHIDAGVLGLSSGGLMSAVQDLIVTPLWMSMVWAVHALVVMLEWAFTIDLLDSAAAGGLGRGLRQMQAAFTVPWLALVLAVASALTLYNGLIRRRVSETVGQTLLMWAMMAGGMWVIADPAGTVGALGAWANQASLGTLAVAARGTPQGSGRALGEGLDTVFAVTIEDPWCYLEFGDVGWCRDPSRVDPALRAAGRQIAAGELALIGCRPDPLAPLPCVARGSARARVLEHGARLLREAQSNGAIFLALPANGSARNSINEPGSLLRALCRSATATDCRGSTAAQAEFRTNGGTWPRVGGLLLIGAGVLGMLLLFGYIAMRLLAAALFSLLFLLLAPGMVLSPALGEGGRAVFRRWAGQLLGAVVSKLLFAFLLGVVLAVGGILSQLTELGWWTQWLLMSSFWWGAFARRRQALGIAQGALGGEPGAPRPLLRRMGDVLDPPRNAFEAARRRRARRRGMAPEVPQADHADAPAARQGGSGAVISPRRPRRARHLRHGQRAVGEPGAPAERSSHAVAAAREVGTHSVLLSPSHEAVSERRAQLERLREAEANAAAEGDTRRTLRLAHRAARVEGEIARELTDSTAELGEQPLARSVTRSPAAERRARGSSVVGNDSGSSAAEAPPRVMGRPRARDYADLARPPARADEESERRRAARREFERELAERREHAQESSVMRDAREVAARRKRQLGIDRD